MAQQVSSIPSHHIGVLFFGNQKNPPFSLDFLSFAEFFFSWGLGGGGVSHLFSSGVLATRVSKQGSVSKKGKEEKSEEGRGGKGEEKVEETCFFFFFPVRREGRKRRRRRRREGICDRGSIIG